LLFELYLMKVVISTEVERSFDFAQDDQVFS